MQADEKNFNNQEKANDEHNTWVVILVGFTLGVLVIQPLGISLFQYESGDNVGNWWDLFRKAFGEAITFGDIDQILKNTLFGILASSLALMYHFRRNIFQIKEAIDRNTALKELLTGGENQHVEIISTLRWDLHQNGVNKALEMVAVKTIAGFMNSQGGTCSSVSMTTVRYWVWKMTLKL